MSDWKMRREEVVKLIAAYRKLKCLWDFRSNEYKHYELKKYSWQKLGKMFGKQAHEVKKKIKHLRSAYVSEKRKVDDSYGTSRIYQPNLFYYTNLNFLDSIIVCRKEPTFENFENTSNHIAESNEQTNEGTFTVEHVTAEDQVLPPPSPSTHPAPSPSPPPQRAAESHLKIKKQHSMEPYSKFDAAFRKFACVTKTTSEDSIYTAFGNTIALQLQQLTPLHATATMSEIHQILSKNIINSMLSKDIKSFKTNRETVFGFADRKSSLLKETSKNRLSSESKYQSHEFEEITM